MSDREKCRQWVIDFMSDYDKSPTLVDAYKTGAESKQAELNVLIAELAKHQSSEFHPDWSMLQASQESLREHMQMVKDLQSELDKANARITQFEEWRDNAASVMAQFIHLSSNPCQESWLVVARDAARLINENTVTSKYDTWLSERDKAVEVKVLKEAESAFVGMYEPYEHPVTSLRKWIESRK